MSETEKTEGQKLQEELFYERKNGWDLATDEEKEKIFKFSDEYMYFLNKVKTEREAAIFVREILEENNFKNIEEVEKLNAGDKVYYVNRSKSVYIAVIGKQDIEKGVNVIGAHIDAPRIDLKPNPLYEDTGLAYFKTHYYGGIKKYQWTTIPLSLHGVIVKSNGEKVTINIGENDEDPIFTITDLLPHLAREQMQKKLADGVSGEDLNLLIGSMPFKDESVSEKVKLNILKILNEKYGIKEIDFASSELEIVPAFKARSVGFDSSMIGAYGQDDRSCAYTSLRAMLDVQNPEKTIVCILSDKEEIGSMGNTGMESEVFDNFIAEILNKCEVNRANLLNKVFCNSKMLSADVNAAYEPLYAGSYEITNSARLCNGIIIEKYTGAGGKYNGSDANAEYVGVVRKIFENNNVLYQTNDMGKVDAGGGGTIAYILANKGMDVLDCGVPLLCMHSPLEITSKYDIYCAYKAYKAFYENA